MPELILATVLYLRRHYLPPPIDKGYGAPARRNNPAWIISQWWTGPHGQPVSSRTIIQLLQQAPNGPTRKVGPNSFQTTVDPFQWLFKHGYTEWTSYQPASRY